VEIDQTVPQELHVLLQPRVETLLLERKLRGAQLPDYLPNSHKILEKSLPRVRFIKEEPFLQHLAQLA
jgi:hypothetical protein